MTIREEIIKDVLNNITANEVMTLLLDTFKKHSNEKDDRFYVPEHVEKVVHDIEFCKEIGRYDKLSLFQLLLLLESDSIQIGYAFDWHEKETNKIKNDLLDAKTEISILSTEYLHKKRNEDVAQRKEG